MTCKYAVLLLLGVAQPALAEVPVTEVGIQSSLEIMDPYLRQMRKDMVANRSIPFDALRALADMGDGLAAFKMAEYLTGTGKPSLQDDALHYYGVAAYTGRAFALPHLLRALQKDQSETSDARLKGAEDALRLWARRGNEPARLGLARMYLSGKPFGYQTEEGLALLEQAARAGNADAAMELGLIYMQGRVDLAVDIDKARMALTMALESDDLAARAMAQNLLRDLPTTSATVSTAGGSE